jgi:Leucine-rich repeat (LRR) protein
VRLCLYAVHCGTHTTVSDGAPADMPSLTTDLTISNSNITHLPSLWLLGRKRLQTLRLHNNNMRRIDDNAFKHMISLRLVDLRANDLQLDTLTGEQLLASCNSPQPHVYRQRMSDWLMSQLIHGANRCGQRNIHMQSHA